MKAVIICPADRPTVTWLHQEAPLAALSLFGKELICHWVEHLVARGATSIAILAADRPRLVRDIVGDGSRWGAAVEVIPVSREWSQDEARKRYRNSSECWLPEPLDVVVADALPAWPEERLFSSYAAFGSVLRRIGQAVDPTRIGLREMAPGIWVGLRATLSPGAELYAPCWIEDGAFVGRGAVVGPWALIERRAVVDGGAVVTNSVVGPDTLVGRFSAIEDAVVLGRVLVNWQRGTGVEVRDRFLLSSLRDTRKRERPGWLGRALAGLVLTLTWPAAVAWALAAFASDRRVVRIREAVLPGRPGALPVRYYEFVSTLPLWERWPQLLNVARGEFAWVGNPPLSAEMAGALQDEHERLWLAVASGLISHSDLYGCGREISDEARAHASFYAAHACAQLDRQVFCRAVPRLLKPVRTERIVPLRPEMASATSGAAETAAVRTQQLR